MWDVKFSSKAAKQARKLPKNVRHLVEALARELEELGPRRNNWPHFGLLEQQKKKVPANSYHCHLKRGHPTFVACWKLENRKIKIIEVFYVGTHENAPY